MRRAAVTWDSSTPCRTVAIAAQVQARSRAGLAGRRLLTPGQCTASLVTTTWPGPSGVPTAGTFGELGPHMPIPGQATPSHPLPLCVAAGAMPARRTAHVVGGKEAARVGGTCRAGEAWPAAPHMCSLLGRVRTSAGQPPECEMQVKHGQGDEQRLLGQMANKYTRHSQPTSHQRNAN